MFKMSRQRGACVIKVLVLILLGLVILVALVLAFYEGRKAYWDYRVGAMCEQDGGVRIYEVADLPKKYVSHDGQIRIPFEVHATENDEYFIRRKRTPIVNEHISVGKHQTQLIRSEDGKVLGELTTYGRGGGDFPTFAHPSSILCPKNGNLFDLMVQGVFINNTRE